MNSAFLDHVQPIPDKEPEVTKQLRSVLLAAVDGTFDEDDYTAEFRTRHSPNPQEFESDLKQLGRLISMVVVELWNEDGRRNYRCRTEVEHPTLLKH